MAQRRSYDDLPPGRDHHHVRALAGWLLPTLRRVLARARPGAACLDVGCGEQPLRGLIEGSGATYTGFDIAQNTQDTVAVLGSIDAPLPAPWPQPRAVYDVVVCTEVLEHTFDWPCAFRNLRALTAPGGTVVLTVPFVFPLHMEPLDFARATPHALRRLSAASGLRIEEERRLGTGFDVAATILEDTSILPSDAGIAPRVKVRALRLAKRGVVAALTSTRLRRALRVDANTYLVNALVLRAG